MKILLMKIVKIYRLSDNEIFEVSIWKRLLKKIFYKSEIFLFIVQMFLNLLVIEKSILKDFSTPSILWGIDGDFMVNIIKENNFLSNWSLLSF